MTKEEAIHFAECLKHNYTINFADMEVFCDMVIKALEQEPCKDAISRAEALKVVEEMDIPEDMSVFEIKSHICVEIGTLPPAPSETPQAEVEPQESEE